MTSGNLVLVGASGWQHPAWRGAFYPADLPDDWQLSYYSTQFQAVHLPAAAWQAASAATWEAWLADTHDGFHFVLEPGAAAPPPPVCGRVVLATTAWEAAHLWWLDAAPDLRQLAQRITRHAETGEPLYVFSRSGDLGLLEQALSLKQVMGY
jgi:uncharacterized protein YecE (DUF72 family)